MFAWVFSQQERTNAPFTLQPTNLQLPWVCMICTGLFNPHEKINDPLDKFVVFERTQDTNARAQTDSISDDALCDCQIESAVH
jgi:hypothetical protein